MGVVTFDGYLVAEEYEPRAGSGDCGKPAGVKSVTTGWKYKGSRCRNPDAWLSAKVKAYALFHPT